jgi:hypothetical protein
VQDGVSDEARLLQGQVHVDFEMGLLRERSLRGCAIQKPSENERKL